MASSGDQDIQHLSRIGPNGGFGGRTWQLKRRKAHHKVKTGCKACKDRRQKCDEQKPICSSCSRYSTDCSYLNQNPTLSDNLFTKTPSTASPTRSLSALPSSDLNLSDLELLHHFLTSTCLATAQRPEISARVQRTAPALAQVHPFAMRGILAMAATHLSRLRPSRQRHYATLAMRNQCHALPDFQTSLKSIDEANCDAVVFFSKSLVWCSLASDVNANELGESHRTENGWLPGWFTLLRGSCRIVESSRPWIRDERHVLQDIDNLVEYLGSPDDDQLSTVTSQLFHLTGSTLCMSVLSTLRESFVRASMRHHNTPYRNAINFWVGSLPDEYMQLLQMKEAWTLIVLAHFCVLFYRSEVVWFMKGHAANLMSTLVEVLDSSWRPLLLWPCDQMGLAELVEH